MKLLIVQLPPFSRYCIPLRSKYNLQKPVLKRSVYTHAFTLQMKSHAHRKQVAEL
jgi:hypothetical protein